MFNFNDFDERFGGGRPMNSNNDAPSQMSLGRSGPLNFYFSGMDRVNINVYTGSSTFHGLRPSLVEGQGQQRGQNLNQVPPRSASSSSSQEGDHSFDRNPYSDRRPDFATLESFLLWPSGGTRRGQGDTNVQPNLPGPPMVSPLSELNGSPKREPVASINLPQPSFSTPSPQQTGPGRGRPMLRGRGRGRVATYARSDTDLYLDRSNGIMTRSRAASRAASD